MDNLEETFEFFFIKKGLSINFKLNLKFKSIFRVMVSKLQFKCQLRNIV